MKPPLLIAMLLITSTQASAAIYTTKPGTKFYAVPNGRMINASPDMIETPPIKSKDAWCFFKLLDGRGATLNPPTGWTQCKNLDRFVGN